MLTHDAAVLEGNAIGRDELEIGSPALNLVCQCTCLHKPFSIDQRKALKTIQPLNRNIFRWIVRSEESVFVVFIKRDQRRNPVREPSMSGERPALRLRQFEPLLEFEEGYGQQGGASSISRKDRQFHFCRTTFLSRPIS